MEHLKTTDPDVARAIELEIERQTDKLVLIASENYVSRAVLEAEASEMTNKYAEGYPGARYYGGCEYVDMVENLAISRAKALFGTEHVNVQPHSGSQANMAVFFAALEPGDTILGMHLSHGGHLTHGSPVSFSGQLYKAVFYGVDPKTHLIDMNEVESLALTHRPKLIIVGASSYPRILDFENFARIAQQVGSYLLVDIAHIAGLVAAGIHPSPVPYADFVTSTTHKTLRGPRGGVILTNRKQAALLDKKIFPGIQGGPLMHIIAAKAVCFKEAATEEFKSYCRQVVINARALAQELQRRGLTIISGGTDNHLMLVDVSEKRMTGADAERALDIAGIALNKNVIPFDTLGPKKTSGIRIGTPAVTTRGMKEKEMAYIAELIARVLERFGDETFLERIRKEVRDFCHGYPIYAEL